MSSLKERLESATNMAKKTGAAAVKLEKDDTGYWRLKINYKQLRNGREMYFYSLEYLVEDSSGEPVPILSINLGSSPGRRLDIAKTALDQLDMTTFEKAVEQLKQLFPEEQRRGRGKIEEL